MGYRLFTVDRTMERSTIVYRYSKTHCFDWAMFKSKRLNQQTLWDAEDGELGDGTTEEHLDWGQHGGRNRETPWDNMETHWKKPVEKNGACRTHFET